MTQILSFFQNSFVYVFACVLLLGILIFIHELGHFLVARWCGVRVETFSLGFGKKIWTRTKGDTTYAISMIPLGGYVKMFGEQPGEEISESDKKFSFTHKTVRQRIAIVLAGPLMNLFFAIVIFTAITMIGTDMRGPVVGDIEASTKAYQMGLRSGDKIVSVNGQSVQVYDDFADIIDQSIGKPAIVVVERAGQNTTLTLDVSGKPNPNPLSLSEQIGDVEGVSPASRSSMVGVVHGSPLWASGLRTGDRIVAINGQKIRYFRDLQSQMAAASGVISADVERNVPGSENPEKFTVTVPAAGDLAKLGIENTDLYLSKVLDGSPAQNAGLRNGDRMVSLDGKAVAHWEDVLEKIKGYSGQGGIQFAILREGQPQTVKIEPQVTTQMTAFGSEDKRYTIGISPLVEYALPDTVVYRSLNPITALSKGVQQSWEYSVVTLLSFVRLFQNKISPKTVGGLLSIGQAAGETMKMGLTKFMIMMGIISINLFVLNLLPVPILDGGHLVFYTIEAIKGSPLSINKIAIAQQVGMVLLMGLMVFALFNDVTRLIFGRM